MHHSRLSTLVIDCQVDDLATATAFWSQALGKPIAKPDQDGDGKYAELQTAADEPIILLQKVDHASRVHLDIETDDLDAYAPTNAGLVVPRGQLREFIGLLQEIAEELER